MTGDYASREALPSLVAVGHDFDVRPLLLAMLAAMSGCSTVEFSRYRSPDACRSP